MKHTDRIKSKRTWMAGIGAAVLILSLGGCAENLSLTDKAEAAGTQQELSIQNAETQLPEGQTLPEQPEGQAPEMNGEAPQMPNGQAAGVSGEMPQLPNGEAPEMSGEAPRRPNGQAPEMNGETPHMPNGQLPGMNGEQSNQGGEAQANGGFGQGRRPGGFGGGQRPGQMQQGNVQSASEPAAIVTSDVVNTASALTADEANAETIVMSDSNSQVKIESAGTYIVTGSCKNGNLVVKKGTTGVVLILKDLDLTSTSGAALSCNKGSEVKIIVRGSVKLTDAEDPADEDSADAEVADAFDGAALKVKDGANVFLTGTGTLTIDASSCKNGIKVGNEDTPSFVIDGNLTVNITAANDGINGGYDVTILSGTLNIAADDDAIHADRILTIGKEDGTGPAVNITKSKEGLEGTVVNLFGGNGAVKSSDDAVNAANSDGTYSSEIAFSINITGGTWDISSGGDGLDSNGNINITGGSTTIRSASNGGEAGLDYMGSLYVADGTLTNYSGVSFDSGMGGMPGQMGGQQMPGQSGQQMPGQSGSEGQQQPGQGGQMPGGQQPGQGGRH